MLISIWFGQVYGQGTTTLDSLIISRNFTAIKQIDSSNIPPDYRELLNNIENISQLHDRRKTQLLVYYQTLDQYYHKKKSGELATREYEQFKKQLLIDEKNDALISFMIAKFYRVKFVKHAQNKFADNVETLWKMYTDGKYEDTDSLLSESQNIIDNVAISPDERHQFITIQKKLKNKEREAETRKRQFHRNEEKSYKWAITLGAQHHIYSQNIDKCFNQFS